jgi:hypothetical protein
MAAHGRVQRCESEAYCDGQLDVWTVTRDDDGKLGQRVTRLDDDYFCECHRFVERALQCKHICAAIEHEATKATPSGSAEDFDSALHWALSRPLKTITKRGRPRDSFRRCHLAEGTRVLVQTNETESQVAVIVASARDTCDVKMEESDGAAAKRVPARSIVDWLKPGSRQREKPLGTVVPLSKVTGPKRVRKKARREQPASKTHVAPSPPEAVRSGPWPTAIKWKIQTTELVVRNTCPYDAALAALMHIPADGIQAFIESRVEHDAQLARARELFWSGSVTEASAPRCRGRVGEARSSLRCSRAHAHCAGAPSRQARLAHMRLCGLPLDEGLVDAFGTIDGAARPLVWLASQSARIDVACEDPACSRAQTPERCDVEDAGLVVDMGVFALEAARRRLPASVEAGFAWRLAKLAQNRGAEAVCPGVTPRRLRDRVMDAPCGRRATGTLHAREGELPPVAVAEFGEQPAGPAGDIYASIVPEASLTVHMGSLRGEYDLAAVIYHVGSNHFVSQFLYKGRAFYHDGMVDGGEARLVGDRIDVQFGFRVNSHRARALSRAVYMRRSECAPGAVVDV